MKHDYGTTVLSREPEEIPAMIARAKSDIVQAIMEQEGLVVSEGDLVVRHLPGQPVSDPWAVARAYIRLPSPTLGPRTLLENLARWRDSVARVQ